MGNIIFGILFIIGGLSGSMALRGTGSTAGLAVVGAIFLVIGIAQVAKGNKQGERSQGGTRRTRSRRPARARR